MSRRTYLHLPRVVLAGVCLALMAAPLAASDLGATAAVEAVEAGAAPVEPIALAEADLDTMADPGSAEPGVCREQDPLDTESPCLVERSLLSDTEGDDETHAWNCPLKGNLCSLTSQCNHTYPDCACCICLRGACYCDTWACH